MAAPANDAANFADAPAAAPSGADFAAPPRYDAAPSSGAPQLKQRELESLENMERNHAELTKKLLKELEDEGPSYHELNRRGIPVGVIRRMLRPELTFAGHCCAHVIATQDFMIRRVRVSAVVEHRSKADIESLGLVDHKGQRVELNRKTLNGFIIVAKGEEPNYVRSGEYWIRPGQTVNSFTYEGPEQYHDRASNRTPLTLLELVMLNAHSKKYYEWLAYMHYAWGISHDLSRRSAPLQMHTHVTCLKMLDEMTAQIRSFQTPERFLLRQFFLIDEEFPEGRELRKGMEQRCRTKLAEQKVDATPAIVTTVASMKYWHIWSESVKKRQPWLIDLVETADTTLRDPARHVDGCSALRRAVATGTIESWIADTVAEEAKARAEEAKVCADDTSALAETGA